MADAAATVGRDPDPGTVPPTDTPVPTIAPDPPLNPLPVVIVVVGIVAEVVEVMVVRVILLIREIQTLIKDLKLSLLPSPKGPPNSSHPDPKREATHRIITEGIVEGMGKGETVVEIITRRVGVVGVGVGVMIVVGVIKTITVEGQEIDLRALIHLTRILVITTDQIIIIIVTKRNALQTLMKTTRKIQQQKYQQ